MAALSQSGGTSLGELAQAASMDVVWWKDRLLCKLELWREDERARLRMGPRL